MTTKRIKLERILMPQPVAAGMNYLVIASLTLMFKSSNEDAPPVLLEREGRYYRIVDGRHRFVASHVAGRRTVLAEIRETHGRAESAEPTESAEEGPSLRSVA